MGELSARQLARRHVRRAGALFEIRMLVTRGRKRWRIPDFRSTEGQEWMTAKDAGWIDGLGYITEAGIQALEEQTK